MASMLHLHKNESRCWDVVEPECLRHAYDYYYYYYPTTATIYYSYPPRAHQQKLFEDSGFSLDFGVVSTHTKF